MTAYLVGCSCGIWAEYKVTVAWFEEENAEKSRKRSAGEGGKSEKRVLSQANRKWSYVTFPVCLSFPQTLGRTAADAFTCTSFEIILEIKLSTDTVIVFHSHAQTLQSHFSAACTLTNPAFSEIHLLRAASHRCWSKGAKAQKMCLLPAVSSLSRLLEALFNRFNNQTARSDRGFELCLPS